jgi:hypothetical protein
VIVIKKITATAQVVAEAFKTSIPEMSHATIENQNVANN